MNLSIEQFKRHCIAQETDVEGGYVNDPKDLGKETNHGITIGLATSNKNFSWLKETYGWSGNMKDLTKEMAYALYGRAFWEPMYLDDIAAFSYTLANTMFRWGLKSGNKPVIALQETLNCLNNKGTIYPNLKADGWMGPITIKAIESLIAYRGRNNAMTFLVAQTNADQMAYLKHITLERPDEENERFYWGWGARAIREQVGYVSKYGLPSI